MTIAGQLSVTASDDPRFAAGDSIGIVIDAACDVIVTQNVEVTVPAPLPVVEVPTASTAGGDATAPSDTSPGNPASTPPATA